MSDLAPANPGPPPHRDGLALPAFACAAVALGQAIHVRDGEYWPAAVGWLAAAIVLAAAGALLRPRRRPAWWGRVAVPLMAAGAVVQIVQLLTSPPSGRNSWSDDLAPGTSLAPFRAGVAIAGVLILTLLRDDARLRRVALPLLLVTHFVLGVWLIRTAPDPHIDVYVFQQEGAKALLRGENPYAATFPDIYRSTDGVRAVYGADLTEGGRVHFGFPYLPLSLFMALPGYLIAGDHRYAQLAAMTLAGALVALARPGRVAALAAALLLFTPRGFFILGRGWTEPFTALLLALTVFLACRDRATPTGTPPPPRYARWGLPFAAGLLLATKQYLALAVPLLWLLLPRPATTPRTLSFGLKAFLAGALVTLPLVLADVRAFWRSTVTVQLLAPYRTDALTFQNFWLHRRGLLPADGSLPPAGSIPPTWPAPVAALLGIALVLWRAERSPAGFAGGVALVFLLFISLNKQAFANYYYFVVAALCCAAGATTCPAGDGDPPADLPSSSRPPTSDN
jgi:hypothetical protein